MKLLKHPVCRAQNPLIVSSIDNSFNHDAGQFRSPDRKLASSNHLAFVPRGKNDKYYTKAPR